MVGYRQQQIAGRYDAIVIGSGAGGLVAAVLLTKYGGQRVLVLERHYLPGGFTQSFHRPGFDWDVGLHYFGLHDETLDYKRIFGGLTGGSLEWSDLPDVYDRVMINARCYEFWSGRERFRETMKHYFPEESGAIDRYLTALVNCSDATRWYFSERAMPAFLSGLLGHALRWPFLRYARRTTAQVLGGLTANRELVGLLAAQWGCYGLPPAQSSFGIHACVARHYLDGASYPRGGACRIVAAMAPIIESKGGAVTLCADVAQILVDSRNCAVGVRMADSREIRAARVISDAGFANTFRRLLPPHLPCVDALLREVAAIPPSCAHVCLYVGLEGAAPELGLTGTNLWIYPGPDHDGNLARFLSDPDAPLPFLFISSGSAKDPDFARRHPGHSTVEVLTATPYDWFRKWENTRWKKRGPDYEAYKAGWTHRLLSGVVSLPAGNARPRPPRGAFHSSVHSRLRQPSPRRDVRPGPYSAALRVALPGPADADTGPVPHGAGRLYLWRFGRNSWRDPGAVEGLTPKPAFGPRQLI